MSDRGDDDGKDDKVADDDDELDDLGNSKKWILKNFIIQLHAYYQLSVYPHLLRLMDTVYSSCHQLFSRTRAQQAQVMCDNWMKLLMILALEKYVLDAVTNDEIIDSFAELSNRLKKHLQCIRV
jgi:hypothetical protein